MGVLPYRPKLTRPEYCGYSPSRSRSPTLPRLSQASCGTSLRSARSRLRACLISRPIRKAGGPRPSASLARRASPLALGARLACLEEAFDALRSIRRQSFVLEQIKRVRIVQGKAIAFEQSALVDAVRIPGIGKDVSDDRAQTR